MGSGSSCCCRCPCGRHPSLLPPPDVACEGWLAKSPPGTTLESDAGKWQRRWVVLEANTRTMVYYTGKDCHTCKGTIPLDEFVPRVVGGVLFEWEAKSDACSPADRVVVCVWRTAPSDQSFCTGLELVVSEGHDNVFSVRTPSREYYFAADTSKDRTRWMTALPSHCRFSKTPTKITVKPAPTVIPVIFAPAGAPSGADAVRALGRAVVIGTSPQGLVMQPMQAQSPPSAVMAQKQLNPPRGVTPVSTPLSLSPLGGGSGAGSANGPTSASGYIQVGALQFSSVPACAAGPSSTQSEEAVQTPYFAVTFGAVAHWLRVTQADVLLLHYQTQAVVIQWPLAGLRAYGQEGATFTMEAGRRCPSGPGVYTFFVQNGRDIARLIDKVALENSEIEAVAAVQQQQQGNSATMYAQVTPTTARVPAPAPQSAIAYTTVDFVKTQALAQAMENRGGHIEPRKPNAPEQVAAPRIGSEAMARKATIASNAAAAASSLLAGHPDVLEDVDDLLNSISAEVDEQDHREHTALERTEGHVEITLPLSTVTATSDTVGSVGSSSGPRPYQNMFAKATHAYVNLDGGAFPPAPTDAPPSNPKKHRYMNVTPPAGPDATEAARVRAERFQQLGAAAQQSRYQSAQLTPEQPTPARSPLPQQRLEHEMAVSSTAKRSSQRHYHNFEAIDSQRRGIGLADSAPDFEV